MDCRVPYRPPVYIVYLLNVTSMNYPKIPLYQRLLVVASLALTSCAERLTPNNSNIECSGGKPVDQLVYDIGMQMVRPGKGVAVAVGWGKTPRLRIGQEGYIELHVDQNMGGEFWQNLDGPLSPGNWTGAQHRSDQFRFSASLGWSGKRHESEIIFGYQLVRTDEFCITSEGQLHQRTTKER